MSIYDLPQPEIEPADPVAHPRHPARPSWAGPVRMVERVLAAPEDDREDLVFPDRTGLRTESSSR